MSNKLTQSRIVFKGDAEKIGKDVSVICSKTSIGSTDTVTNPSFDLSSKFTFESITFNSAYKAAPVYFPFKVGLQYSVSEIKQLCIDNNYDVWIAEGNNSVADITSDFDFLVTEDNLYLTTEAGDYLITG